MENRIKVLQLISSEGFFGAENVLLELSSELMKIGISATIGVFNNAHSQNLEIATKAKERKIRTVIFDCGGKVDFNTSKDIKRFISQNNISLLHAHGYKADIYGFFATRESNLKKISTCHNWVGNSGKLKLYHWLDKSILRKFDAVVAVSNTIEHALLSCGIPKNRISLIRNGVDIDKFSTNSGAYDTLLKELGIENGSNIIGVVGRLSEEKGHQFLLEAFKNVLASIPRAKLVIVGDGKLRNYLEELSRSLGLAGKVIFTGKRNDVGQLLSIFDVFVLPSLIEGMPISLLEAMAAKRPVIATKVGEIPNIIRDGYSGFIVEPKNKDSLGQRIIDILNNKSLSAIMAERAYECLRQEFSLSQMAQSYSDIYKKLLI